MVPGETGTPRLAAGRLKEPRNPMLGSAVCGYMAGGSECGGGVNGGSKCASRSGPAGQEREMAGNALGFAAGTFC